MILAMAAPAGAQMADIEHLGRMIFMDTNLSEPPGQSCASCHHPMAGFADPDTSLPVSEGAVAGLFGNRNSPTAAYASFSPVGLVRGADGVYIGGQFWDGRAPNLVEQAKGPFLNPVEMNNESPAEVVRKVQDSHYASMFTQVFGRRAFKNTETAYHNIARAIAAFEKSSAVNRFSSKYDAVLAGSTNLSAEEADGELLFTSLSCVSCHPSGGDRVFTNFTYHDMDVPPNPVYPGTANFEDPGLGGFLNDQTQNYKFKAPTLRNIAVTPPYGHTGYYMTLEAAVDHFIVATGKTTNSGEVASITAFLKTLTDSSGGMGGGGTGGGGTGGGGGMGGGGGGRMR